MIYPFVFSVHDTRVFKKIPKFESFNNIHAEGPCN